MEKENSTSTILQIWKIIIIPIVVVLIPIVYSMFSKEDKVKRPHFIIQNPILNPGESQLTVSCQNCNANTPSEIIIVVNNIKFSNIHKDEEKNQSWIIDLEEMGIIKDVILEGRNIIRLGFEDENLSEDYTFYFKKKDTKRQITPNKLLPSKHPERTPEKIRNGKIELILPSRFKNSKIYINGKEANIIDRNPTKVVIQVTFGSQNSKIEIIEEGRLVCEEEIILDDFKILTPCAN